MKHEELRLGKLVQVTDGMCKTYIGRIKAYSPNDPKKPVLIDLGRQGLWDIPLNQLTAYVNEGKQNMETPTPLPKEEYYDIHYQTELQPIEFMQANMTKVELIGFLKGNIIKYAGRFGRKDEALKEAQKIKRYAGWLVDVLEGKTIDPRK